MPGWAEALAGDVLDVAPRLLGAVLRHESADGVVAVRLTEVEAYDGPDDPGSHAANGRTRRNDVMFGPAGRLYVYLSYGMHHCANVVVGPEGQPSAVLLRAGEVVEGADLARQRRGSSERDLARGPGRLCQALGIDLTHDRSRLDREPLTLALGEPVTEVRTGPRVGLSKAADRPWRFWVDGDPTVSAYRPAVRRKKGAAPTAPGASSPAPRRA